MIKVQLPQEVGQVEVRHITDVHVGDPACNMKKFEEDLKWVMEADNRFLTFGGDLYDAATRGSVGDVFESSMNIREQRRYLYETLKPIAEAGKCIVFIGGNHEDRVSKETGEDITESLAMMLNVPYTEDEAFVQFRFGKGPDGNLISYVFYIVHGVGGGISAGGRANSARRGANVVEGADVYISGHTHAQMAFKESILRPYPQRNSVSKVVRLYVACGSYVDRSRYAIKKQYAPSFIGSPVILLDGTKKNAKAVVG